MRKRYNLLDAVSRHTVQVIEKNIYNCFKEKNIHIHNEMSTFLPSDY